MARRDGRTGLSAFPARPARTQPGLFDRARGLVEASHPFPIAMVMCLTALVGVVSAGAAFDGQRLGLVLFAMLLSQVAIGWSNDFLDREGDALVQPHKPVAAGLVDARALPPLIAAALAGSLLAGALLGVGPLALLVAGTGCGFAYNLGIKDTRLSWLPYVAAFAVLPPFVWLSLDAFRSDFLWLYAVGSPLVVAVHVANALPDADADRAAGRWGLVAQLGRGRAPLLLGACFLASPAIVVGIAPWVTYEWRYLGFSLGTYALLGLAAARAYGGTPSPGSGRWGFKLVAPAAVVLAVGWLAAV